MKNIDYLFRRDEKMSGKYSNTRLGYTDLYKTLKPVQFYVI
jgi:hypothetical protein